MLSQRKAVFLLAIILLLMFVSSIIEDPKWIDIFYLALIIIAYVKVKLFERYH